LTADPEPLDGAAQHLADQLGYEWSSRKLGELRRSAGGEFRMTPRYAGGQLGRLPDFLDELLKLEVSVILASGPEAAQFLAKVDLKTPVVVAVGADLTRAQLFDSTTQPPHVTGVSYETQDLARRRLELIRDAMPQLSQVGVLWNAGNWAADMSYAAIKAAAQGFGLPLSAYDVRTEQDIKAALTSAKALEPLLIVQDPLTLASRGQTAVFAPLYRIPLVLERRSSRYSDGVLLEVGPDMQALHFQAAAYVERIIQGIRPAALPMEEPAKLDIVVNQKTAGALGLTIPQSVLTQTTQLIQ
jgi:putative ABC transport system substrate-binding protein